jgi:glycerophosphoryl diester phosphodiesterase
MKRISIIALGAFFLISGCINEVEVIDPEFTDGSILEGTSPIEQVSKDKMEGIYKVEAGSDLFGEYAVVKWNDPEIMSIFTPRNGGYFILGSGKSGSSYLFEGKWRHSYSLNTGLVRLAISEDEGGSFLNGNSTDSLIVFRGRFGEGNAGTDRNIILKFIRHFSDEVKQEKYYIVAHRGGGRNSDYRGASENSIEMISKASRFGANGIEIDVKLSKDNVPFLYHDSDINLRLTQKSVIWGNIEDYSIIQLKNLLLLKNGEMIPTLREALEHVLENTDLNFVWLDMKSSKNDLSYVIPIQKEILQRASSMGRELEIVIGLPTDEKYSQFISYPDFKNIPSLCELSVDQVREADAEFWGPRWTRGPQNEIVLQLQSEGRKAITWTLDDSNWIKVFSEESSMNGILTNYPSQVAYYRYIK